MCYGGSCPPKGVHRDPGSPRGNLELRTVQRNVFLPEMLIADKGCSVLPMGTEGADCLSPDSVLTLLGPGTTGLDFCCLLLPLQPEKRRRLLLEELGRLTIKVSFLRVYQD